MLPNPYGTPVSLEDAKKATAPAIAEARKNNWMMAVAVVDPAGNLVYFEKMDGTQTGSVAVAISKARSAALFTRPTKAFQDVLAGGGDGLRMLGLEGAVPVEGGVPLLMDGKIVGAIGGVVQAIDEDVSGYARRRRRGPSSPEARKRRAGRRRRAAHHGRQDRRRDRVVRRHEPAGRPVRPGRRERVEVAESSAALQG